MPAHDLVAILDGVHPSAPLPELRMIPQDGLTAVLTSKASRAPRLPRSQRDILIEAATRLRWQEACMPLGTLLPVRQDSPLTKAGAAAFLIANRPTLVQLMGRFAGRVQVQLCVGWHPEGVLDRFRDEAELAPLFAAGRAGPQMLSQAIARLTARLSRQIETALQAVSVEIAPLPTTPAMLWNGAVLVSERALDALSAMVEEIDAIWPEGLQIRQIGPAPVGSFATLMLNPVSPQQVEAARNAAGMQRESLRAAAGDMDLRERIRTQSQVVAAAARLPDARDGFCLVRLWAEGQSTEALSRRAVA